MFTYYRLTTSKAESLFKNQARRIGFFKIGIGRGADTPEIKGKNNFKIGIRWVGGGGA